MKEHSIQGKEIHIRKTKTRKEMKNHRINSQTSEKVYSSGKKKKKQSFEEFAPYYRNTGTQIKSAFAMNQHQRSTDYSTRAQHPPSINQDPEYPRYGKQPPHQPPQHYGSAHHIRMNNKNQEYQDPRFFYPKGFKKAQFGSEEMRVNSDKHIKRNNEIARQRSGFATGGRSNQGFDYHQNPNFPPYGKQAYPPSGNFYQRGVHRSNSMREGPHPNPYYQKPYYPDPYYQQNHQNFQQHHNRGRGGFHQHNNYPKFHSERMVMPRGRGGSRNLPPRNGEFYPQRDMRAYGSDMMIKGGPQGGEYYGYNYQNERQNGFSGNFRDKDMRRVAGDDEAHNNEQFKIHEFMEGEEEEEENLQRADVQF